jgi:hypothetical protein
VFLWPIHQQGRDLVIGDHHLQAEKVAEMIEMEVEVAEVAEVIEATEATEIWIEELQMSERG